MDFILIFERLFPGENVSPRACDGTYAEIAATWRGSAPIPTLQECEAEWDAILLERPELGLTGAARIAKEQQTSAKAMAENEPSAPSRAIRALAVATLDEVYTPLQEWIVAFKQQVAQATSLNDLKSRIANNLPNIPVRNKGDLVAYIKNKIDGNE